VAGTEDDRLDPFLGDHPLADLDALRLVAGDDREQAVHPRVDDGPMLLGVGIRGVGEEQRDEGHATPFVRWSVATKGYSRLGLELALELGRARGRRRGVLLPAAFGAAPRRAFGFQRQRCRGERLRESLGRL